MTIRTKALGLTAVAVAAALALAGCSSTGGAAANSTTEAAPAGGSGTAAAGGGAVADTPNYTIAMVTHETPGDTFWDKIRSGAEAAAAKDNITLKYSNDPTAVGQATLIQNAVDSKVDGIAVDPGDPGRAGRCGEDRRRRGHPGGRLQLRHRRLQGTGRADVLRLRRDRRR